MRQASAAFFRSSASPALRGERERRRRPRRPLSCRRGRAPRAAGEAEEERKESERRRRGRAFRRQLLCQFSARDRTFSALPSSRFCRVSLACLVMDRVEASDWFSEEGFGVGAGERDGRFESNESETLHSQLPKRSSSLPSPVFRPSSSSLSRFFVSLLLLENVSKASFPPRATVCCFAVRDDEESGRRIQREKNSDCGQIGHARVTPSKKRELPLTPRFVSSFRLSRSHSSFRTRRIQGKERLET